MRFLVIGAGAVGSFFGGSLARAGYDVTLLGRGAHFRAIAQGGLSVRGTKAAFDVRVGAVEDAEAVHRVDVVLVAVKAHHLPSLAPTLRTLAACGATIVTMQNGLPFWFFDGFGGRLAGTPLRSVDPDGSLGAAVPSRAVVACIVSAGLRVPQPGTVEQVANLDCVLGEANDAPSSRPALLAEVFRAAGMDAVTAPTIRRTVWDKLIVNAAVNPVGTLARANADEMVADAEIVALLRDIMAEQAEVGAALGLSVKPELDRRMARIATYRDQRTSMLQDLEAGKPLEVEPIVGAAVEVADLVDARVPATRHVYALIRTLSRGMDRRRREG